MENEDSTHRRLREEERVLADSFEPGTSYASLKKLIGSAEFPGKLQELDTQLNEAPPTLIGTHRQGLMNAFNAAHQCQEKLSKLTEELRTQSDQVSFRDLYKAVIALQKTTGDRCPACNTPLSGSACVTDNPYERATDGLEQLRALGELEKQQKDAQSDVTRTSQSLRQLMGPLATFIGEPQEHATQAEQFIAELADEPQGEWWTPLYPPPEHEAAASTILEQLLVIADSIESQDTASRQVLKDRAPLVAERQKLLNFQLKVQAQDQHDTTQTNAIKEARARIEAFDTDNTELIAQVEQEKRDIERDTPFKEVYDRFLEKLKIYREQLPGQLLAGLNDMALTLYNEFNQNDLDADKLESLHLPLTGDDKIEISFRGNPAQMIDALHVLSEGHIRCLGLAILLAKAKSINCPVIVFDDVINAIDHDHRRGIRETIFESVHFAQTQVIVTCHSNEFIKDIQQHLPAHRRQDCQVYLFRHHTGDYQPRVSGNVETRNSIAKARAALDARNDRDALDASRKALEVLSNKVWQWLGFHNMGLLTLPIAGSGAEPGLRNLCDALCKKLKDARTFVHDNKEPLIEAYDRILGIPADNLIWKYLNQGTHEVADRDDFDGAHVEAVVLTLEQLGRLDLRRPK